MTTATKILNTIFVLTVVLFLLDILTGFDIRIKVIKTFIYLGALVQPPLIFAWNFFVVKQKRKRIAGTLFPLAVIIAILVIGPLKIIFTSAAWQTQTILYQHERFRFRTVEFQMQDLGALGYDHRTVEVCHLTPLFMVVNDVSEEITKKVEWIRVDKEVNELRIKYP